MRGNFQFYPFLTKSECNHLAVRQSSGLIFHWQQPSLWCRVRMLTCCAADTVPEQTGPPVLLLHSLVALPVFCYPRRIFSSCFVWLQGGVIPVSELMVQGEQTWSAAAWPCRVSERERERERPSELWSLLILSICLPVLMLQVKLTACTGDPRLRGSRPCRLVFYPEGDGFVLILVNVCCTVAPRQLRHPLSATGSSRCSLEMANWFVRHSVVDPTGG